MIGPLKPPLKGRHIALEQEPRVLDRAEADEQRADGQQQIETDLRAEKQDEREADRHRCRRPVDQHSKHHAETLGIQDDGRDRVVDRHARRVGLVPQRIERRAAVDRIAADIADQRISDAGSERGCRIGDEGLVMSLQNEQHHRGRDQHLRQHFVEQRRLVGQRHRRGPDHQHADHG